MLGKSASISNDACEERAGLLGVVAICGCAVQHKGFGLEAGAGCARGCEEDEVGWSFFSGLDPALANDVEFRVLYGL